MATNDTTTLKCTHCSCVLKLNEDLNNSCIYDVTKSLTEMLPESISEPEMMIPTQNIPALSTGIIQSIHSNENENSLHEELQANSQVYGWAQNVKVASLLFDYLNAHTEIDHPLCKDCADALIDVQKRNLSEAEEELATLEEYLSYLQSGEADSRMGPFDEEVATLEREEAALMKQLQDLEAEEKELDKQIAERTEVVRAKKESYEGLLQKYNELKLDTMDAENELRIQEARDRYLSYKFRCLRETNALQMAFQLTYDGHIGVINGLRLGRLPSCPVEWAEINAAWGTCLFLLHTLARHLNIEFPDYKFVLLGATSSIRVVSKKMEYPLYYYGYSVFGDNSKKFDLAMMAFVACMAEMTLQVRHRDNGNFPYRFLTNGSVQDEANAEIFSVKYQGNSDENWTKALKAVIIMLNYLIVYVTARRCKDAMSLHS